MRGPTTGLPPLPPTFLCNPRSGRQEELGLGSEQEAQPAQSLPFSHSSHPTLEARGASTHGLLVHTQSTSTKQGLERENFLLGPEGNSWGGGVSSEIIQHSGSQPETVLPPGDIWQCLETIRIVKTRVRGGATEIWWVEAKDAAEHPAVHRTAPRQRSIPSSRSRVPDLSRAVCFTEEETKAQKGAGPKSTAS